MLSRKLRPGQRTEVWVAEVADGSTELVYSTDALLLEAPNWAPDGRGLLLNGDGLLWRLDLGGEVELAVVPIDDLPPINNDHVLDAKRGLIYLSANDGHIYVAPIEGGTASRVTHDPSRYHFLHGVSPDGATLAFVELPRGEFSVPGRLGLVSSAGDKTRYPDAGSSHLDGPEYSPDGEWLYFNTEEYASRPGHAQLARMPEEGGGDGASGGVGDGRLVSAPLAGRETWVLHQLSSWHAWASARPGSRGARGSNRRLAHDHLAFPPLRRSGHDQRQQLVAGQSSLRLRGVSAAASLSPY